MVLIKTNKGVNVLLILSLFLLNCANKKDSFNLIEIHGHTMGTTYMVKIITNDQLKSTELEEITKNTTADIKKLLKKINRQMSTFLKDSEISRFNRYGEPGWFEVSADTAAVIAEALRVSEISNGAFDITVGPLINLWGFGTDKKESSMPGEQQIKELMDKIGYQKLSVRHSPPAIKKEIPNINCNLSALAKGLALTKQRNTWSQKDS